MLEINCGLTMNNSDLHGKSLLEDDTLEKVTEISDWDDNNVVVIDLVECQRPKTVVENKEDEDNRLLENNKKTFLPVHCEEDFHHHSSQSSILRQTKSDYGLKLHTSSSNLNDKANDLLLPAPDNGRKIRQKYSSIVSQNQKLEPELAPIRLRAWEKRTKNPNVTKVEDVSLFDALTPLSCENRQKLNFSMSKNGRWERPMSVICTSSNDFELKSPLVYRSVLRKWSASNGNSDTQLHNQKIQSNGFVDGTDCSLSLRTRTRSSMAFTSSSTSSLPAKMTCIEKNLFLGNMEAATDVILLESNAITHIVSVDSVPLPRKISSILPRVVFKHLQISDLPDEDLLSCLVEAIDFIDSAISKGGTVLVHCFRGRSRSATVAIAYLMYKHRYTLERAFYKVKSKRENVNPHIGFLAQLKMFESMEYTLDSANVQYKMFRLFCASERMRKAKILFRDSLEKVLDPDPAGGLPGSAEAAAAAASKNTYPMIFKCRKCKRTLATAFNMLPHVRSETPNWMDNKWARLSEVDVLDDASSPAGLDLCSQSVFITPMSWMEQEIKQNLGGKLYCPNCPAKVGSYSWVRGELCHGCGAVVLPAFQLDMTEIIFRTHNRYLQSGCTSRGPILV